MFNLLEYMLRVHVCMFMNKSDTKVFIQYHFRLRSQEVSGGAFASCPGGGGREFKPRSCHSRLKPKNWLL